MFSSGQQYTNDETNTYSHKHIYSYTDAFYAQNSQVMAIKIFVVLRWYLHGTICSLHNRVVETLVKLVYCYHLSKRCV